MRPVIGIDPSMTATGVAWDDGSTEVICWPDRGVERLANVYRWVGLYIACRYVAADGGGSAMYSNGLVLVEGYAHGKGNQAHQMGELGAAIRLALHHEGCDFLIVPPSCVKKYATGKGNANKDLVRDAARDRLGLPAGVTSDECDAAWLRQIGLALLGDPSVVPVPKTHLEALKKLELKEAA